MTTIVKLSNREMTDVPGFESSTLKSKLVIFFFLNIIGDVIIFYEIPAKVFQHKLVWVNLSVL